MTAHSGIKIGTIICILQSHIRQLQLRFGKPEIHKFPAAAGLSHYAPAVQIIAAADFLTGRQITCQFLIMTIISSAEIPIPPAGAGNSRINSQTFCIGITAAAAVKFLPCMTVTGKQTETPVMNGILFDFTVKTDLYAFKINPAFGVIVIIKMHIPTQPVYPQSAFTIKA